MQRKHISNIKVKIVVIAMIAFLSNSLHGQLESFKLIDTSAWFKDLGNLRNKYSGLSFTGYIQTQFQYADTAGATNFNGGNFQPSSNNRFYLRRARIRADYEKRNKDGYLKSYFVVQFDGTDRGVNARDMFGRLYENKYHNFILTMGLFNRPFGNELQYSSALRESPERGRMSQILMTVERDFGAMVSFAPQDANNKWRFLNVDLGIFNGQGLTSAGTGNLASSVIGEFDQYKDIIARISLKKLPLNKAKTILLSAGISHLNGGWRGGSAYRFTNHTDTAGKQVFSSEFNTTFINGKTPRIYTGADFQLVFNRKHGSFELRAETIFGIQSAAYSNGNGSNSGSTVTPGIAPTKTIGTKTYPDSISVRNFSGAYFYALYKFFDKHQVFVKYDWYDPNTKVAGLDISSARGFSKADIRFNTIGLGYIYYFNDNVKLVLYAENPMNEKTKIIDKQSDRVINYGKDIKDRTYTVRLQFRF
jgi:hypothetical protein